LEGPVCAAKARPLGTELHDRFLLPHFVWQDFEDGLGEFKEHGYALDPAWFAPHFEFKFPRIGEITQRGVNVEVRTALEPWPAECNSSRNRSAPASKFFPAVEDACVRECRGSRKTL